MRGLDDFLGRWTLSRRVTGVDGALVATFAGQATLAGDADRAEWTEAGMLRSRDGPPLTATRRYLWARVTGGIAVAFLDGRPFHDFDPAGDAAEARHSCRPDVYEVAYDFSAWPAWRTTWRVTGPRKRLTIQTRHVPAPACAAFAPAARTAAT